MLYKCLNENEAAVLGCIHVDEFHTGHPSSTDQVEAIQQEMYQQAAMYFLSIFCVPLISSFDDSISALSFSVGIKVHVSKAIIIKCLVE